MKNVTRPSAMLALMFSLIAMTSAVQAQDLFAVRVKHNINGRSLNLGLSKELPVIAKVYRNEVLAAEIPLEFKEIFESDLPSGNYRIEVFSEELGANIDSMEIGPLMIPGGASVRITARLSRGKTPILAVK